MSTHHSPASAPDAPASPADERTAPRRGFIGQLLGGAAAVAAGALTGAAPLGAQSAAGAPSGTTPTPRDTARAEPRGEWDMSWVGRLTSAHRHVFDAPAIAEGTALHQARMYLQGFHDVYGAPDGDLNAVIVVRHHAMPMVVDDPIWARYDFIGKEMAKVDDPTTGKPARRNPFVRVKPDDQHSMVWPDGALDTLIARGVIVLGCNMALMGLAGQIAKRSKEPVEQVQDALRRSLVPGVTLMPSGIFAVTRAQEAGCHYLYSGA